MWGNNMNILLSILVPIYNVKGYIEKCIESICNQSYRNLEIILVDDGSTDGSGLVCDEFASHDERVRVIHKANGGLVSARKAGAQIATGDYIVTVDGDDWIGRDRCKNLVEAGLKTLPSMVYMAGHYKEYEDNSVLVHEKVRTRTYVGNEIEKEFMQLLAGRTVYFERKIELAQWLWCVKREIYCKNQLQIDDRISMGEDGINIFSCILDSSDINCICEPSYHYVQRKGSITFRDTDWGKNHADYYYKQMKRILSEHRMNKEITNVAVQYMFHNLLLTNYKKIYDKNKEYLFPYPEVKRKSRIIVYGAGNLGVEIVNAIDMDTQYQIVSWVDRNKKQNPRSPHKVECASVIKEKSYDYIIVAVVVSEIAESIKKLLVSSGVPEDKIALMQSTVMTLEKLDEIIMP